VLFPRCTYVAFDRTSWVERDVFQVIQKVALIKSLQNATLKNEYFKRQSDHPCLKRWTKTNKPKWSEMQGPVIQTLQSGFGGFFIIEKMITQVTLRG